MLSKTYLKSIITNIYIIFFFYMPTYKEKKQRLRELVKQQEQERINLIRTQGHPFKAIDAFRVKEK